MELLAVVLCLLAVPVMVFLRNYTRRVRAELTVHKVGDPAVAHRALIDDADDFADRPVGIFPVSLATWKNGEPNENITTVNYGPHWSALRCNLTAEILHPTRLASLAPMQQEATRALVADLSAQGARGQAVVVRGHITAAVFALVARLCFGDIIDDGRVRAMGGMIREFLAAAGELSPRFDGSMLSKIVNWRGLRQINALIERQAELYRPLIEARRRSRLPLCAGTVHPYMDSLLDLRIADDDDAACKVMRELRDGELVGLALEFLGAGMGSVSACVEWTLAHLIDQPEVQEKLRREIDDEADAEASGVLSGKSLRSGMPYLNAVVLESLRMHPPVPFIMRGAHGEGAKAVPGVTAVPMDGSRVLFNLGHIGRDGKTWTNPDEFRPERFLAGGEAEDIGPAPGPKEIRMMPFGAGHRHCPGMNMGMLHIKCFLAALVREFEWAAPSAHGGGVDMAEHDGFLKLMKKPLCARVTGRK